MILICMVLLQFWRFCGDATVAFMYAFAINVMIESPFDRFQKNVMKLFVGGKNIKIEPNILAIWYT